jgi:5-methylcytosine-specific restriction endonuclease McrA
MADQIITRAEARAQGLKTYFDGRSCPKGHIAERIVANYSCAECGRLRSLSYQRKFWADNPEAAREKSTRTSREWRQRNPEKDRARHDRRRDKAPEKYRLEGNVRAARWRERNREKTKAASSRWRENNQDRDRASRLKRWVANRDRLNQESREWRAKNRERHRALVREWRKRNPDSMRVYDARRRARKLKAGGSHTLTELKALLAAQNHRCAYCRADLRKVKKNLDHIMPLALGGSNDRSNLQWTCHACNLSKGKKSPIEFAQQMGRLL